MVVISFSKDLIILKKMRAFMRLEERRILNEDKDDDVSLIRIDIKSKLPEYQEYELINKKVEECEGYISNFDGKYWLVYVSPYFVKNFTEWLKDMFFDFKVFE